MVNFSNEERADIIQIFYVYKKKADIPGQHIGNSFQIDV